MPTENEIEIKELRERWDEKKEEIIEGLNKFCENWRLEKEEDNELIKQLNEFPQKSEVASAARNVLIIGRTGSGKSTLTNVLTGNSEFSESSGSTSKTKKFQHEIFEWEGITYRVFDTIGIGDTKLSEEEVTSEVKKGIKTIPGELSHILLVINGRFERKELEAFKLLKEIIGSINSLPWEYFENSLNSYTTIVRTNFPNFGNSVTCNNDKEELIK